MAIAFNQTSFLISAAKEKQFVVDSGAEAAFVGRSNAGKSSALNTLTNNHKLARISKTPGRTRLINFFAVGDAEERYRLVDLPGYGYAKVPMAERQAWNELINHYLHSRQSLKGLVLLSDIRHSFKPSDWQIIEWTCAVNCPLHILLTKADKLSRNAANKMMRQARKLLDQQGWQHISTQLFSATKRQGVDILQDKLSNWLGLSDD
ncbi:MAG: ribosome biogenesis GTP-binding protein YihA/YsxC [Pseudomonadota bacterium]